MSRIPITQVPSLDVEVRVGTMPQNAIRIIGGGILGGLAGGLVMTFLYELPPIHALLFNPDLQSNCCQGLITCWICWRNRK